MPMKRTYIIGLAVSLVVVSLVIGTLSIELSGAQKAANKLYSCPLSIGDKTYTVTVVTNETAEPKVSLPEFSASKYFSVSFTGTLTGNTPVFFNITYPCDLLWGNFSLVAKYYLQDPSRYTLSNNGTYQSVYMEYTRYGVTDYFEIHGTEAAW